jgi:predicted amidohydrolase
VNFRAALVQMCAGTDMVGNLADVTEMIRLAKSRGADFVTTPEMTNIIEPDRPRLRALVRSEAEDETVARLAALAADLGLWINVGSLALKGAGDKLLNRSLLMAPSGSIAARYDKIHLFDVDLPTGEVLRESNTFEAGSAAVVVPLPWCTLGMTVCYDVRFPALYRMLAKAGATVMTIPSAFTVPTGKAHWHVLMRARAIETGSFVLAAAQGGHHASGRETYGHSLAVSPWGKVLAEGATGPEVLMVDIDPGEAPAARRQIPVLDLDSGHFPSP